MDWFSPSTIDLLKGKAIYDLFTKMTGANLRETHPEMVIEGWAFGLRSPVEVLVVNEKGEKIDAAMTRKNRQDVYSHYFLSEGVQYNDALESGFYIKTIKSRDIFIAVKQGSKMLGRLSVGGETQFLGTDSFRLSIESTRSTVWKSAWKKAGERIRIKTLGLIGKIYQWMLPVLFAFGLILFVISLKNGIIFKNLSFYTGVPFVLLFTLSFRLLILAMIDISSFSAYHPHYLSPAYPLILIFTALTVSLLRQSPLEGK